MANKLDITDINKLSGNWNYPTSIKMGAGTLAKLPESCQALGMAKPLLVTDAGLANFNFTQQALSYLKEAGLEAALFSDVKPNPTGENVDKGVEVYRSGSHDGIVALGGGSGLDAAKAIAVMADQECSLWDLEDIGDNWLNANPEGIAPIVAIPTTAGTGSEVGRASVILDEATEVKKIIFHPKMLPEIVLSDPELLVGLPSKLTAATGVDAFVHCLEAYLAPGYHPMADGIAIEGMRLIKEWLPAAVKDGTDLVARSHTIVASSMGATAFQKGLGGVHALAHPLGALYDAHHGLLNAIILPYVLERNKKSIESRATHLASCLGIENPSYRSFYDWVLSFREQLEIPHSLADIGIHSDQSERVGAMAAADPSAGGNPIPLSPEEYAAVFCAACEGH